jgi:Tfp pilus assembly protein PilP
MIRRFLPVLILTGPAAFSALPTPSGAPAEPAMALETVLSEEYIAEIRDPFALPSLGPVFGGGKRPELTLFSINDLKLNGVITGPKKLRAMVSAPNGKTFFVKIGDPIGMLNGKITQIRSDAITVVEFEEVRGKRVSGTKELRIGGELVTLSSGGGD